MRNRRSSKKERVIHTRVPEALDDEIKRRASGLGLSVSNLVRNVLQNTIGLVEDIVQDSTRVARSARGEPIGPARSTRFQGSEGGRILGWQVAILNVNAVCDTCNTILTKGTQAAIGVVEHPGPQLFRCERCLKEIRRDDEPKPSSE
jgi:hypothetical protein